MAEQPRKVGVYDRVRDTATQRRGGVPSWVWILVALIILALLAWWASTHPTQQGTNHWAGHRSDASPGTSATGTAAIRHKLFRNRCAAQSGAA